MPRVVEGLYLPPRVTRSPHAGVPCPGHRMLNRDTFWTRRGPVQTSSSCSPRKRQASIRNIVTRDLTHADPPAPRVRTKVATPDSNEVRCALAWAANGFPVKSARRRAGRPSNAPRPTGLHCRSDSQIDVVVSFADGTKDVNVMATRTITTLTDDINGGTAMRGSRSALKAPDTRSTYPSRTSTR
jgi:hypothetical protein